jgi:hypothetical protein
MEAWLIDKDFANYWTAARLLLSGQVLDLFADHASYFRHLTAQFGPDYQWRNWSYPPHYLLAIWPLGLMGYIPALAAFLTVTLLAYLLALRAFVGRAWPGLALSGLILAPAVLHNLHNAQNGFLTGALMLGGLALRTNRPVLAGVLIGCLTIKPQLGVLLPLLLLFERRWLVIAVAALTTLALVGLSAALFGWETWHGYLTQTVPYQSRVMTEFSGLFLGMMPTVFGTLRVLGIDPDLAIIVHGAAAGVALVVAARVLWRCEDARLRAAITIMTTLVITPYWLTYDYTIAAGALLLTCGLSTGSTGVADRRDSLMVLAALVPIVAIPSWSAGLPLAPLLVLLGFGVVLWIAARPRTVPVGALR